MENKQNNNTTQTKETEKKTDTQKDNVLVEKESSNATSPTTPLHATSPTTNAQTEMKKSYKLALTKELPLQPNHKPINEKLNEKPTESKPNSTEMKQNSTESKPSSTEQTAEQQQSPKETNNIQHPVNATIPKTQQPWKKNPLNANTPKFQPFQPQQQPKKKKEDEETLTDLNAWPSLEEVKTEPVTAKKKEIKKEDGETNGTTDTSTVINDTTETVTSPKESQEQNSKKKGGVNWIPLEIEAPRQHHNTRGRGGPRGGRPNLNNNNPMNRPSWRSQGTNPRGGNRRGRGGYNPRPYIPPSMVYFPPQILDPESLKQAVLKQIEYYYSVENLCKDTWLRSQMDDEGWTPVTVIAAFNRLKQLTTDTQLILEVLHNSTDFETKDEKMRKKEDWKTWLPPKKEKIEPEITSSSIITTTTTV